MTIFLLDGIVLVELCLSRYCFCVGWLSAWQRRENNNSHSRRSSRFPLTDRSGAV